MTQPPDPIESSRWLRLRRRLTSSAARGLMALASSNGRVRNRVLRGLLDQHLAPGVLCLVPFVDHMLYVDPRDDKVALKLLSGRPWQKRELDRALHLLRQSGRLRPDGVFIDVGANIGAQTVYAMRSGAFARGLAIEPDPHNFEILSQNLAINGLDNQVIAICAAASAASGTLLLSHHGKNFGAHSVEPEFIDNPAGAISVAAATVDELLQQHGIGANQVGLVKIDVEGHELSVLDGMAGLRMAQVPVLVEFNADPRDAPRIATLKSLFAPKYRHVADLGDGGVPTSMPDLRWTTSQADLLIY